MHRKKIYRVRLPFVGTVALARDPGEAAFSDGLLVYTDLHAEHRRGDQLLEERVLGSGVITVTLVNTMVSDAVTGSSVVPALARFKFMDSGTGTTAATDGDTALQTPTGVARVTATLSNAQTATTSNHTAQLKYTGTITYNASYAVTEWGQFDASTAGNLMDHRIFSAINVANGKEVAPLAA
jgi:hypothetical protein